MDSSVVEYVQILVCLVWQTFAKSSNLRNRIYRIHSDSAGQRKRYLILELKHNIRLTTIKAIYVAHNRQCYNTTSYVITHFQHTCMCMYIRLHSSYIECDNTFSAYMYVHV